MLDSKKASVVLWELSMDDGDIDVVRLQTIMFLAPIGLHFQWA